MSTPTHPSSSPTFGRHELASVAGGRWYGAPPAQVHGVSTDTRAIGSGSCFVALAGARFDGHAFLADARAAGAAAAIVADRWLASQGAEAQALWAGSPALPLLAVLDPLASLGALARFHRRRFSIPVVGVTGSNGKTTTREMIAAILRVRAPVLKTEGNLNNEIGVPLTLLGLRPEHERAVIEMGMNHPGEVARLTAMTEPHIGVVTLAGAAHLEAMGSVDSVADAKAELYFGIPSDGVCVVNADDPNMLARAQASGRAMISFAAGPGRRGDVVVQEILSHGPEGLRFTLGIGQREVEAHLPLVGLHNAANAAAAAATAVALGYCDREIVQGLREVKTVGRRLRMVQLASGVTVIDDCYNANPVSMRAALATLRDLASGGRRAVAVLGDMLELGAEEEPAHLRLGEDAGRVVTLLAAFGPRSRHTAAAARSAGLADVFHTEDIAALIAFVKERLSPNDVLLVKGSRGMQLERLVEALG
jgi:UDP-N-acetylmuramoyl-tripeptide--D-alanyl-D-alanine ligase